jgi:hypothetical protein
MSTHFRDPYRYPITPTVGVPAYPADAVPIQKYHSQAVLYCDMAANGATGVTHIVWGFLSVNNAPMVIQSLVNVETTATNGRYAFEVPPPPIGGAWVGIAVQQTVGAGGPPTTNLRVALS